MTLGDLDAADGHLGRALSLTPLNPVALFLRGTIRFRQEDLGAAELSFRQALNISPGHALASLHLAQTLRALKRPNEAIVHCRAALATEPDNPDVMLELAKAQEESGDLSAAESSLRRLLQRTPGMVQAVINLSGLLIRRRHTVEAEGLLRYSLQHREIAERSASDQAELVHLLAICLKLQRRHQEALGYLDTALTLAPASDQIQSTRALVLQHLRRFEEAIAAYRAILERSPLDLDTHLQLNELLYRQGHDQRFLDSYELAARRAPRSPLPLIAKGQFLLQARNARAARDAFELALHIDADSGAALLGLGRSLEALGDLAGARTAHDKSVSVNAGAADAFTAFAGFLLRNDDSKQAFEMASRAHQLQPTDQSALAMLGLCYRAIGDKREYQLNNYDAFVQVFDLEAPDGYEDIQKFNLDLSQYLDGLQSDVRENFTQTLRGGTRLYDELFYNGHELVDKLCARIEDAIRRYVAEMRVTADHPFTSRKTSAFTFSGSWSSRIAGAGYHLNHIHPSGWISSAYYVAVPDCTADPVGKQGWLKFGEPSDDFGPAFPPRITIPPRPGRLVLFPSYMWHGTVPYQSSQARTSIAFDVVPLS